MKVKDVIEMFGNWNAATSINDKDSLNQVVVKTEELTSNKDRFSSILEATTSSVKFSQNGISIRVDMTTEELLKATA